MSRTSDPETDELLGKASKEGMLPIEVAAWRRHLDVKVLDTCGCKASAKAGAVVAVFVGIGVWATSGVTRGIVWGLVVGFIAAAVAKFLGAQEGKARRVWLTRRLENRVTELSGR
jgi:hypothetical protein